MIHMHNTLSSVADMSSAGNTRPPLSQATLDSFQGALSDAVSSTLQQFGIDPNAVQVSITPTNTGNPASTPAATSTTAAATPDASTTPYNPFLQAATESW